MQLYCPSCQANYAAKGRCPKCGDRLITAAEAFATVPTAEPMPSLPPLIAPTAPARVAVGTVVALGAYLGLRDWAGAGLVMAKIDASETGVIMAVTVVVRLLAVVAGSLLAGAGRPQGAVTGLAVGAICGGLFSSIDVLSGQPSTVWDAVIGAVVAGLGAGMGSLGGSIWPPAVSANLWKKASAGSSLLALAREGEDEAPPTHWLRIAFSALILVAGVCVADLAREAMRKVRGGPQNIGNVSMAPVFDVQIAAVFVGLAGLIAASGTGSGLRHGFITGIAGGLGVIGFVVAGSPYPIPVMEGLVKVTQLPIPNLYSAEAGTLVFFSILTVSAAGGWLGGELMPKLAPEHLRRRPLGANYDY